MGPPLEHVSGFIPPHQLQEINKIGADRGTSAGLRDVVVAGLLALRSDMALLQPVEDLQALVDKLANIQGRKTPSGSWWCPTDESLPSMDQLDPRGDVIAQPAAVALITGCAALVVDADAGVITIRDNGREQSVEAEPGDWMGPFCRLPAIAAHLAHQGPGRMDLGGGMALELLPVGVVRLSLQGLSVLADYTVLMRFASESLALGTRVACKSVAARLQLERQLQGVPQ